jgi:hypothetical protein
MELTDGSRAVDHEMICNTLNNYFESVFVAEPHYELPVFTHRTGY